MVFIVIKRVIAIIVVVGLTYSLAFLHVEQTRLQNYESSLKQKYDPKSGSFFNVALLEAFHEEHKKIFVSTEKLLARITPQVSGDIITGALTQLRQEALFVSIQNQRFFIDEIQYNLFDEPVASITAHNNILHTQLESKTRQQSLESAVVAWETELSDEKIRILAEEARKAAEVGTARLAAIAAAEKEAADKLAAAEKKAAEQEAADKVVDSTEPPATIVVAPPSAVFVPETAEGRLNRISATLLFTTLPAVLGNCDLTGNAQAVACYTMGDTVVVVVPSYMNRRDCKIRQVIAHENRHHWQFITGKVTYDAKYIISNAPALESDAYAFAANYGC